MSISDEIEHVIKSNKVVLFMKGSKGMPMCGFSSRVVSILSIYYPDFHDIDVLENENLRQSIKEFSNWPTIPQLYIDGEFIGGCDIIESMHANDELSDCFKVS